MRPLPDQQPGLIRLAGGVGVESLVKKTGEKAPLVRPDVIDSAPVTRGHAEQYRGWYRGNIENSVDLPCGLPLVWQLR